jgi:Lrp/AsnC family transcriptional regulator, regulator for asnA, asnC and gidA
VAKAERRVRPATAKGSEEPRVDNRGTGRGPGSGAPRPRSAPGPQPPIDDTDRAIIEQLQRDGRLPYTRLGAAVGLSEAAARQRVQRLLDAGVMQVVAVTDPLSLGMGRMAMIGVRAEGDLGTVAAQLGALRDVEYLVVVAGSFDFLLEVVVEDDEALLEVMNRVRAIPGVHETETFLYLKLAKQTFAWGAH